MYYHLYENGKYLGRFKDVEIAKRIQCTVRTIKKYSESDKVFREKYRFDVETEMPEDLKEEWSKVTQKILNFKK